MLRIIMLELGIFIKSVALIILLLGVIPAQYRELKRANGLKGLKKLLFALGVVASLIITLSIAIRGCLLSTVCFSGWTLVELTLLSAIAQAILAIVLYFIYHPVKKSD